MAEITACVDAVYRRTLRFGVSVAAELAELGAPLRGGHTVGEGCYYTLAGKDLTAEQVAQIQAKLQELVDAGDVIRRVRKPWKEALAYFASRGLAFSRALLATRVTAEVDCYECRGALRLAVHHLHETLGALRISSFELIPHAPGLIVSYARDGYARQPALMESHKDHITFCEGHGVTCVGDLNALQEVGRGRKDFVLQCEFRQEQKLASIATAVRRRSDQGPPVKVICIAGPSSSGKTTFSHKLCMYLSNLGFVAKPLTVDHYYLPLDKQPKYQIRRDRGDVDYDHIESMDVDLVGAHLRDLCAGRSVMTPVYNMKTGYREGAGHRIDAMPPNGVLVIEGIHALNPLYTQAVDAGKVFKIFISPLTCLQLDDCNTVKTTDHRLLRRMCRDYLFRGNSASMTLKMWDNVRRGEGVWIFPHQNGADFVMNSAAEYELPVLKTYAEPLLREVTPDDPNYPKARELLELLDRFCTWPPDVTPAAALLREFIGEGAFGCH